MKKVLMLMVLVLMMTSGCGAYYAQGPWKGRVLDAETKVPIEGAAVVIYWDEHYFAVFESNSSFLFAKEFLTDKDGRFEIHSQSMPSKHSTGQLDGPHWYIYKNGYDFYP